jgi:hypothetical protein
MPTVQVPKHMSVHIAKPSRTVLTCPLSMSIHLMCIKSYCSFCCLALFVFAQLVLKVGGLHVVECRLRPLIESIRRFRSVVPTDRLLISSSFFRNISVLEDAAQLVLKAIEVQQWAAVPSAGWNTELARVYQAANVVHSDNPFTLERKLVVNITILELARWRVVVASSDSVLLSTVLVLLDRLETKKNLEFQSNGLGVGTELPG